MQTNIYYTEPLKYLLAENLEHQFSTTNFTNGPNIVVTPVIPRSLPPQYPDLSFKFPTGVE